MFLGGVALDYGNWMSRKGQLQKAADAAALAAAKELSVAAPDQARVTAVSESVVRANLGGEAPVTMRADVLPDRASVRVRLSQPLKAMLSRLVAVGPDAIEVSSTATLSGRRKICVIAKPHLRTLTAFRAAGQRGSLPVIATGGIGASSPE